MKIIEESFDLSEDELRFKNDPKIIKFNYGSYYPQMYGLYCKSTTILKIGSSEYEKAMQVYGGLASCYNKYFSDKESQQIYFRTKNNRENQNDGWLYDLEYIDCKCFLAALKEEYNIDEYLIVPAYYGKIVYETGEILVSKNELKHDFPEIEIGTIGYRSKQEGLPSIGYIDYYHKYNKECLKLVKKMDIDIYNEGNSCYNWFEPTIRDSFYYRTNEEYYKNRYDFNIKYYHPRDSIEFLRKKMKKISLSYFDVDE